MKSYKTTNTLIIGIMFLCFWLVILFLDASFSGKENIPQSIPSAIGSGQSMIASSSPIDLSSGMVQKMIDNSQVFQDLSVLEYIYTKNKNPKLLQPLVEKFTQYYQFDKANQYLSLLVETEGNYIKLATDPRQVIYTRFHDSSIGLDSNNGLDSVFSLIKNYAASAQITQDDQFFYQGLKSLWVYDYSGAALLFAKITDVRYHDFLISYQSAVSNSLKIKNPPPYYTDGLVSLALLKNGYFIFAKRLALHALQQNQDYILPYQVLAYANFLTHQRESSKDYFLKLADFDMNNASLYKFLIGVSYYWYGDYEQSILYLTQVTDSALQTDVYRYMLLGYIQGDDTVNMLRMWQNLLGQSDLQSSDFSLFFDQMFYFPFRSGQPFSLYFEAPQLVDMYNSSCSSLFTGNQADVCSYGDVGLQLAKQNLAKVGNALISLTTNYHQSHLYHLLGDYYILLKQDTLAKEAYIQALSICDTSVEQTLLQDKLSKFK